MDKLMTADPINRKALIKLMQALVGINSVNPLIAFNGVGEADICRANGCL
jgi:hypothetical protein